MVFESNITIKKDDLEKWLGEQMKIYVDAIVDPKNNRYKRVEGLIAFGVLNRLRVDAGLGDRNYMLPAVYRILIDLYVEARHHFVIMTHDKNPFESIDAFMSGNK